MKSHTHTFAARLNTFFLLQGEDTYICEFEDCFCLDVDVLGLDFLSAVVDRGIDVLCLGALVGADALDQLVQALLKHASFSQCRRLAILLLSRVCCGIPLGEVNPDKARSGDISVNLVNIGNPLLPARITQSIHHRVSRHGRSSNRRTTTNTNGPNGRARTRRTTRQGRRRQER